MKKTLQSVLIIITLFAPVAILAQATDNAVQLAVIPTSPAIPSTCASLSAVFSINITEMDSQNNIATIYTAAPWSPTSAQLAQLAQLIELGQPLTAGVTPASATATTGGNATFTAVTNAGNPQGTAYQWQFNGSNLSGQTNATLTLTTLQPANAGNYSVQVSVAGLTVTSANATLTVNSP